jgi:hypothetical protein
MKTRCAGRKLLAGAVLSLFRDSTYLKLRTSGSTLTDWSGRTYLEWNAGFYPDDYITQAP